MALGIDTTNLVAKWLPAMEEVLSKAAFAKSFQVHRVYVCAIELSTDEGIIAEISGQLPVFSVTQRALDWQPEEELDEGEVYSHLVHMGGPPQKARDESLYRRLSTSHRHFASALSPRFAQRAGDRSVSAFGRKSFRLSTLEVYGIECQCPGYHVGATAFDGLLNESDAQKIPKEWWASFVEDEGPQLLRRPARSAVLWQVQVDIVDLNMRNYSQPAVKRQRRYGPFQQLCEEPDWDPTAEAKQYNGVRYRPERRSFIAETRLPKRRNKVSFGDFKSCKDAAHAIDAVFYYYGFSDKFNFADTPQIMSRFSKPPPGLDHAAKLNFVKEQAKLVVSPSFASPITLPEASSPTDSTGQSPASSTDVIDWPQLDDVIVDSSPPIIVEQPGGTWQVSNHVKHGNLEQQLVRFPSFGSDLSSWFEEQGPAESRCRDSQDQPQPSGDEVQGSPFEEIQSFPGSPCGELLQSLTTYCAQSPGHWRGIQDDIKHVLLQQELEQESRRFFERNSRSHAEAFPENAVDFSHSRYW